MKKILLGCIVVLIGVCIVWNLLTPGLAVTHDGQDHVARIANFYQSLSQGNIVPRWAENLNWGYGHPIIEFLYPLPSYIASFFYVIGFSLIDSTKIVFAIGMVASGIAMYLFITSIWGEAAGLVGGVVYMLSPYRIVDLYVRGDIGENLAFVFIPLTLLCIYKLTKNGKGRYLFGGVISLACLILAHNAISLIIVPLIFLYGMYLFYGTKDKAFLIQFLLLFIGGFILSAFFWIPALLEGKYTLRNIVTHGGYSMSFINVQRLLYGPWSYGGTNQFTVQLGILSWVGLLGGVISLPFLYKKQKMNFILVLGLLIYTVVAIFLMFPQSDFLWKHVLLLQNFQFPWRFLGVAVVTLSLLPAFLITFLPLRLRWVVGMVVIVGLFLLSLPTLHAKAYRIVPETFFTGVYPGTTDTGESAPIWSVRFMEKPSQAHLQAITFPAAIHEDIRQAQEHTYTVQNTKSQLFVENTLYFPGWKVLVDKNNVPIQFQDPHFRGLMTFIVPSGSHTIKVVYGESRTRLLSDILSIGGICVFLMIGLQLKRKKML